MALLEIKNLTMRFAGILAVNDASFSIDEGEIVSLIGPNGAGKTTVFSCISSFLKPTRGLIRFADEIINGMPPHQICKKGLVRTFQIVNVLKNMTVRENIIVGALNKTRNLSNAEKMADEIMQLTDLWPKRSHLGNCLTIADMKRLEIARTLATKPKMILLDEVMAGLNQSEIQEAVSIIRKIHAQGITLLIVEHNMEAIMALCSRIIVIDAGAKIMEGSPKEVIQDRRVIEAYLGDGHHA